MKGETSNFKRRNKNPSKLDVFKRIIDHEIASGYADRAVIGGLDRFILKWSKELSISIGDSVGYSILTVDERKAWISEICKRFSQKTQTKNKIKKKTVANPNGLLKLKSPITKLKIAGDSKI